MNDLVEGINGAVFANSQTVADRFERTHKNVLGSIDTILRNLNGETLAVRSFFIEKSFINSRNREYRRFDMTRDGFSLLAMGFIGKEALKFKLQFIEAFNNMESELKRQAHLRSVGIETRKTMTDKIKDTGENERMHGHGYSTYTKLAYKLIGIKYKKPASNERLRDGLCIEDLDRLETVEDMIKSLLKAGKEYGDIKELIGLVFASRTKDTQAKKLT